MQLKMAKSFNVKSIKQILQEENKFISDIFSKMPLPMAELGDNNDDNDDSNDESPPHKKAKEFPKTGKGSRAHTVGELYEKLNKMKGQKSLSYKQKQEKKGLKNRLKKKEKKNERLKGGKVVKTEKNGDRVSQVKSEEVESPKVSRAKPVFNAEGNMVFSKFDFSEIGTKKKPTGKDPKKLLQQVKEKKEKIKQLVDAGETEKAQEIKEKDAWQTVLAKSSGVKVKDDPELLKRTIKREDHLKKRSAKKWESRIAGVEKGKEERQKKRTDNIMKRKKDKKTNKLKKAAKRGRIIPGY